MAQGWRGARRAGAASTVSPTRQRYVRSGLRPVRRTIGRRGGARHLSTTAAEVYRRVQLSRRWHRAVVLRAARARARRCLVGWLDRRSTAVASGLKSLPQEAPPALGNRASHACARSGSVMKTAVRRLPFWLPRGCRIGPRLGRRLDGVQLSCVGTEVPPTEERRAWRRFCTLVPASGWPQTRLRPAQARPRAASVPAQGEAATWAWASAPPPSTWYRVARLLASCRRSAISACCAANSERCASSTGKWPSRPAR
ncbi:hypothetical protein NB705_002902 [Xanthomonas sacchari]|nr:hypothetical protein [Xanthomonas sacchari]